MGRVILVWMFLMMSAVEAADNGVNPSIEASQFWIGAGFFSYHFDRQKHYREDNIGISLQWDYRPEISWMGGRFMNSEDKPSHYLGMAYYPWVGQNFRLGVYAGGFDGYPKMRQGGWFVSALPILSWQARHLGINVAVVPTLRNRVHGAVIGQIIVSF